jgi:hypothetical protein
MAILLIFVKYYGVKMKLEQNVNSRKVTITDIKDYLTIKQLTTENPAFTEGGIRSLIFHANKNGFENCIRRIGRRILISRNAFTNWIEAQNKRGHHGTSL